MPRAGSLAGTQQELVRKAQASRGEAAPSVLAGTVARRSSRPALLGAVSALAYGQRGHSPAARQGGAR
ncbi:hypothetical protein [Streptomyces sp. NPDC096132]|uniref:hypothetical protein n=1 Tax=Streptomyces sp. NPDC096132 TaxID=3366075 RepID=UPI00382A6BF1